MDFFDGKLVVFCRMDENDNFCSHFFALIQGGSSSFMSPWWLAQYTEH